MPELPSLTLSRHICKAWLNDDFIPLIIYGDLRIGKSAYSIKVINQVLEYFWGDHLTRKNLKQWMGWEPSENVDRWGLIEKREPVFCWDDAGYWLHSMNWSDPLLIAIQKYFNVIGTDMNSIIMTTPDPRWILSKLSGMPGMKRVKIIKATGDSRIRELPEHRRFARIAKGYQIWRTPDLKKHGVNKRLVDEFSCKIWPHLYEYYKPERERYAAMAKKAIRQELKVKHLRRNVERLTLRKKELKLEKEIKKLTEQAKKKS